jgi:hypothetical protein
MALLRARLLAVRQATVAIRPALAQFYESLDQGRRSISKRVADALSTVAMTPAKEQSYYEAPFVNRIYSLQFCPRPNLVGVGDANCPPERNHRR